jgi:hypothetical protein
MIGTALLSSIALQAEDKKAPAAINAANTPVLAVLQQKKLTDSPPQEAIQPRQASFENAPGRGTVGATVGYGRIQPSDDAVLTSSLLEPLLDNLLETHAKSGGVSWRVFANYVAKCSSVVYLGAEIGYTAYPETRYSQGLTGIPLIELN